MLRNAGPALPPKTALVDASFADSYDDVLLHDVMRRYYGSDYYNVGWWSPGTVRPVDACNALVDRVLAPIGGPPARLLDAGCGLGAPAARMLARWPSSRIDAIGTSERQLARARAAVPGVRFLRMDAARLEFEDGCFDAVAAIESALHFPHGEFFAQAFRVLRPGGDFVLCDLLVPSRDWPGAWTVPDAGAGLTPESYARLLSGAGFSNVRVTDATAECWDAYVERFAAFAANLDDAQAGGNEWRRTAALLAAAARPAYVLASAKRAAASSRKP